VKDNTPLDPFSSGYIPPPSPTPSEYVIVEHTTDQPQPPQTSRDKRESRSSLLDTIVPEEGRDFSTLGSVLSGRQSTIGHRRTRSGEPSGSSTSTTPPPKRLSNRLHKPRPSLETSSSFLRPTSPFKLHRSLSPIQFPKDPFEASVEEEGVGPLRSSMDRTQQSSLSHDTHEVDGLPGHKPVSARPSMDGVGGAAGAGEKGMGSRKRSHIRTPSSPTFFSLNRRVASTSVLSLHKDHQQQQQPDSTQPYLHSQADASVYDFDIYRQPDDPALQPPLPISTLTLTPTASHPPPASAARLSAALSAAAADVYGAGGASAAAKKRFSASMSDLPALHSGTTIPNSVRFPASASSNQVNMFGKEGNDDNSKNGLAPTTNLYIPKESLDLPT
ncbi:1103_t:CDS:1, partial [Acaulospora colombiana]